MSLRRDHISWVFIGALLAAVGVTAYFVLLPQLQPHLTLRIGDGVFTTRVVTPKEFAKYGTRDIGHLREDKAVLRMYSQSSFWSIEMKNRQESFDLVWLDNKKKVVHIVKNASADSTPSTLFSPLIDARYIIELRGGIVDSKSIHIDQEAYFDEKNIKGLQL